MAKPKQHIMVVNDTQEILDLMKEILEDEGYRVTVYSYAIRDVEEVLRVSPDLLVVDYIIGGESWGWQFLQKIKLNRETALIPVVVCTGATKDVREMEGYLREKHVRVVLKPFDIDDLLRAVTEALNDTEDEIGKDKAD